MIEPYLDDTDEGIDDWGVRKLQPDAPQEIKDAYDKCLRLRHIGTLEDRQMLDTWFQTIKPYIVHRDGRLKGVKRNAPSEVKDAYEKLKRSGIVLDENGAIVKF